MKKNNCIIVGGGICGLFSSILLADKFDNVYLIEKDSACGGLLKSIKDDCGVIYDQGTHIPNTTLVPDIDNILFGKQKDRSRYWNNLGKLKSGNFFAGNWNLINHMLDVRNLPSEIYQKGITELLSLTELSRAKDLMTYLNETIGQTFASNAILPIIKKLYGGNLDYSKLAVNSSVRLFGLSRLLALNPIVSKKLKELPVFDEKLAYHNIQDYDKRLTNEKIILSANYYPKNNEGVGFWVDHLIFQAKEKNVSFLTGEYISKINYNRDIIKSVVLGNSGEEISSDLLFWTAPPVLALKAAGFNVKQYDISFRSACIFHIHIDKKLLNNNSHYVWNWDSDFKGFRFTLYPNMQIDLKKPQSKLTIEVLCAHEEVAEIKIDDIYREILKMGLIDENSKILSQYKQIIHNTFPIPTFEFNEAVKSNYEELSGSFKNIHIAGRFGGKSWFHEDVLRDAYYDIKEKF